MGLANIEQLVEKYLNAETTLQEEATLIDYFLSNNVTSHLQEYSSMFSYFQESKDETYTKTIRLKPKKTNAKNWKWLQIAASVVLLMSMYLGYVEYQEKQQEKQFAQITGALKLLSTNLKKGGDAVANLYIYENTVHKIFKTK